MNEIINLGNGARVKVVMLKGEAGNDIQSIEKTNTEGLVDTYTITLTDGTTHTFEVTNGRAIVSIEKTSTQGYVDTYTITFNDGTTYDFTIEKATITVDSDLSTTSTNPVENRVITDHINTLERDVDALQTDTANIQTQIVPQASIEETSIASQSYSVGAYLVFNGQLCKVTSAIAQGDTLAIGTNIVITNIISDLSAKMDVGLVNLIGGMQQVSFNWDGAGFQIICRLSATTLVALDITSTSIMYVQSLDNGNTWTTVWTK